MKVNFEYDNSKISTVDEIKISIADLRDLIQSANLISNSDGHYKNEVSEILRSIIRKNRMAPGVICITVEE